MRMIFRILTHLLPITAVDPHTPRQNPGPRKHSDPFFPISNSEVLDIVENWERRFEENGYFLEANIDLEDIHNFTVKSDRKILSIDLGGSSLKLGTVKFSSSADSSPECLSTKLYSYATEEGEECIENTAWYDWVALRVKQYVKSVSIDAGVLTFSYPVKSDTIRDGKIFSIGKNWRFLKNKETFEESIVKSLNKSLKKLGLSFSVKCVVNDVIATYMSGFAYGYNDHIAVILGTGTNGGFTIPKCKGKSMLVNSEWSRACVPSSLPTQADRNVLLPLKHLPNVSAPFEILTSGVKFVEIINEQMKLTLGGRYASYCNGDIDISRILQVFYDENSANSAEDKILNDVVLSFKRRSYKMLSALVVASMLATECYTFDIITNGTAFMFKKDLEMMSEILEEVIKIVRESKEVKNEIKFTLEHHNDASLIGSAYLGAYCLEIDTLPSS